MLNQKEYTLAANNGVDHLHGGVEGFNNVVWDAKQIDEHTLELTYLSKHMEEGYPGREIAFNISLNLIIFGYPYVKDV